MECLNGGGKITPQEREDAERAFIRYYTREPESDRPERFAELIGIHGKLDPLVHIDLRPEKRVRVTFTYGDTSEMRPVDVYRWVFFSDVFCSEMKFCGASIFAWDSFSARQGRMYSKNGEKAITLERVQSGEEVERRKVLKIEKFSFYRSYK